MRSSRSCAWSRRRFRERAALSRLRIFRAACLSPAAARCCSSSSGMAARGRRVAARLRWLLDGNLLLLCGAEGSLSPARAPAWAEACFTSTGDARAALDPRGNLPGLRPEMELVASRPAAMVQTARAQLRQLKRVRAARCQRVLHTWRAAAGLACLRCLGWRAMRYNLPRVRNSIACQQPNILVPSATHNNSNNNNSNASRSRDTPHDSNNNPPFALNDTPSCARGRAPPPVLPWI